MFRVEDVEITLSFWMMYASWVLYYTFTVMNISKEAFDKSIISYRIK